MSSDEGNGLTRTLTGRGVEIQWMNEDFRPAYHYTAEKNMINDPNGLVYLDGEFHLFHQYNNHEVVHWGHAVSVDLVHWKHLPPAISPDALGQIYSGTAVVDTLNTAGLGTGQGPVLVALFTYADHHDGTQSQGLAYSNDRGRTWDKHPGNPVIPNPGRKDFRDPKVFWHEPTDHWTMVLAAGDHVRFYRSPDLIAWHLTGEWGHHDGAHGGVWECPDLFSSPSKAPTRHAGSSPSASETAHPPVAPACSTSPDPSTDRSSSTTTHPKRSCGRTGARTSTPASPGRGSPPKTAGDL